MAGHVDIDDLKRGLEELNAVSLTKIEMYCDTASKSLQSKAMDKASWTDRTGDARKRLTGSYEKLNNGFMIVLAHGIDYGVYLELAMEKKYAILWPTLDAQKENIMKGFDGLIDRLVGKLGI